MTSNNILKFNIGDLVHDTIHGDGKVVCLRPEYAYPIKVKFKSGAINTYTDYGVYLIEKGERTLFHRNPSPKMKHRVMAYVRN